MEIKLEFDNDVIILKPIGNVAANTVEALKEQVNKLTVKNYCHIILDMSRVGMVDSTGLGACMNISRDIASKGGLLICVGLNENVKKLFHLTRVDQKLTIYESKNDAIDAFLRRIAAGKP